jgi:hypothetical protein
MWSVFDDDERTCDAMKRIRVAFVPALAVTVALAASAPAASASTPFTAPALGVPGAAAAGLAGFAGPCSTISPHSGQGATAGTTAQVCQGTGLSFVGPAVGQIATVIGPTIIGPAVVGSVVVSAGNGSGP